MSDSTSNKPQPPKAWKRQPDETQTSWERFQRYRDMGPSRSFRQVAQQLQDEGKISGSVEGYMKQLSKWSSANNWVDRCAEYDRHMDERRLEIQQERIEEAQEAISDSLLELIERAVSGALEDDLSGPQVRMIQDLLDRAGLKPIEHHEHDIDVVDPDSLASILGISRDNTSKDD